ncbi:NYN domain-containing protein [Antarcticimicrobium sediminis]|uniref:RNase NYN domain-containing protein n=1 Tax=Antarcticimicrobium sediminis TaxID=2546227 RepID=A0A4R5EKB1_9RHOB|nr:hypothetical protein [Antarcticimicrobium sediminis]TDE34928.1 hypothetical protein E1B25_18550 [Antarcticimicrobium sediminis]
MIAPIVLLLASSIAVAATLLVPDWSDFLIVSGPCFLASVFLLVRAVTRRTQRQKEQWVIVDGSNVMHWREGTPQIETVKEVVGHLSALGYTPGVMFDANAGYLLAGKYLHDGALAKVLGIPEERVMVVPKGTPADPVILAAARDLGAKIVTNDRFRDWADQHPEVYQPGHLIRGGYSSGRIWLNIGGQSA